MSNEEAALLEAIAREPGEDLHRLGYADWLEENGDRPRAELIRIQCNLERGVDWQSGSKATADRLKELRGREKELIEGMLAPPREAVEWSGVREFETTPELAAIVAAQTNLIGFRRGMIGNLFLLDLTGTAITTLPLGLHVGGDLYLGYTPITSLPPSLYVGGDLHLTSTAITSLPPDLHVGGNLDLTRTGITADAAQRILTMRNLSREAKISGLETLGHFPALAEEARRLPETNAGPGTPPRS